MEEKVGSCVTKSTSLDFSRRGQQAGGTEYIHALQFEMSLHAHGTALQSQSGEMKPFLRRAALVAMCFHNNNALWGTVPGHLLGKAQIIMVMELIICLI